MERVHTNKLSEKEENHIQNIKAYKGSAGPRRDHVALSDLLSKITG